ncbi:MAG: coiled coil domain-containing protein [Candidatus Omnitrophica bacterium]|nr:coiled coil domain-containing protein [Candidatus Omnitrophota bacterium]
MDKELKKAYQEKTEAQLKEWSAKAEELKTKAESMSADAKVKAMEKIVGLKQKVREGREHLENIESAGEGQWETLKAKMEGISEGIKNTIHDMTSPSD